MSAPVGARASAITLASRALKTSPTPAQTAMTRYTNIDIQAAGSGQSTARLMFQLELTGLSSSPGGMLRVLKDNATGFRPMREESVTTPTATSP